MSTTPKVSPCAICQRRECTELEVELSYSRASVYIGQVCRRQYQLTTLIIADWTIQIHGVEPSQPCLSTPFETNGRWEADAASLIVDLCAAVAPSSRMLPTVLRLFTMAKMLMPPVAIHAQIVIAPAKIGEPRPQRRTI